MEISAFGYLGESAVLGDTHNHVMKTLCSAVVGTVALVVLLNNVSSAPVSRRTAEASKKVNF